MMQSPRTRKAVPSPETPVLVDKVGLGEFMKVKPGVVQSKSSAEVVR